MPQVETNSQRAPNLIYCNQIKSVQAKLFFVLEYRARPLFGTLGYGKLNANHFNIIQSCSWWTTIKCDDWCRAALLGLLGDGDLLDVMQTYRCNLLLM